MNAAPVNDGVAVGRPVMQDGFNDGNSLLLQGCPCFFRQLAPWCGIDDHGGGGLGYLGNLYR